MSQECILERMRPSFAPNGFLRERGNTVLEKKGREKEEKENKKKKEKKEFLNLSSVQFSRSVMSDSLRSHGTQHARPPCIPPTPGVYSNSCPLSR